MSQSFIYTTLEYTTQWYRRRVRAAELSHVIELRIPPLRDRPEDVLDLANHFLRHAAARLKRPVRGYTERAVTRLLDHPWPGNIRELEHAIERACVLATGDQVDEPDLPDEVRGATNQPSDSDRPYSSAKAPTSVPSSIVTRAIAAPPSPNSVSPSRP